MSVPLKTASRHALSHELFVRALGGVALLAWLSLHVQLEGLFGPRGIVPLEQRIELLVDRAGFLDAFFSAPSLFFVLGGSLAAQRAVVLAGELAAIALALGVSPGPLALLSFVLYLSFVSVGWPFIPLQWDTLLCEALVLAAILGRWTPALRPRALPEPSPILRWAGYSLVTRLMLASGLVKLLSGDPTWRDGSALAFHHWTQPLPSPLAPLLHRLPAPIHGLETYATLTLELVVPLLVVAGPRARAASAAIYVGLMGLIALSGNYGFFGLLTAVLCLPLVDDALILGALPRLGALPLEPRGTGPNGPAWLYAGLAAVALAQSLGLALPAEAEALTERIGRFHVAGHYGLFAVMTTDRPELVFEATMDGSLAGGWETYDFQYKPGDPTRGPGWCIPHLPRFDWMLWFSALGAEEPGIEHVDPWVVRVAHGLLEDRAEIRALFRRLPLDGARPRALRLVRARYRFGGPEGDPWAVEERVVLATWRRRD